jgi:hypothetical protein
MNSAGCPCRSKLIYLRQESDGTYVFIWGPPPDVKLPLIAAEEDTGPFTKALLEAAPGKNLIAYRSWMTMDEYVEIIARVKGIKVINRPPAPGVSFEGMASELLQELTENMQYFVEFGYEGKDDPTLVHPKDVRLFSFSTIS